LRVRQSVTDLGVGEQENVQTGWIKMRQLCVIPTGQGCPRLSACGIENHLEHSLCRTERTTQGAALEECQDVTAALADRDGKDAAIRGGARQSWRFLRRQFG
jgi:hypothetical protein